MGTRSLAVVTGASRGFGYAVTRQLVEQGWRVVIDARHARTLATAARALGGASVVPIVGDVTNADHREDIARVVDDHGHLDLLVNNAGALGPSPLPAMAELPEHELASLLWVNVSAPLALTQRLLPALERGAGIVVNITSDAAVEAYPGWGGYGASKAALDHISAVLAVEHPNLRVYAFDPGDMATQMHQLAFPDEDISDRPAPDQVAPSLMQLVARRRPSGRYRASDLATLVPA